MFRQRLQEKINTYMQSRTAAAELANNVVLASAGATLFKQLTPGALSLGPVLAGAVAQQAAIASLSLAENLRIPLLYTVNARATGHLGRAAIDARCLELLGQVGLAAKAERLPRDLTQIEMRKLELARAMAAEPKLLIADESMAGLSNSEVTDIVALLIRLNERGITIIMIEHIMRAVMTFSQRLVVLVSGKKIADGAPDVVIRDPEVERAYLGQ